jgi:hypothetical protein
MDETTAPAPAELAALGSSPGVILGVILGVRL